MPTSIQAPERGHAPPKGKLPQKTSQATCLNGFHDYYTTFIILILIPKWPQMFGSTVSTPQGRPAMPRGAGADIPGLCLACQEAQLARRGDRALDTRRHSEMELLIHKNRMCIYMYVYTCIQYWYVYKYIFISITIAISSFISMLMLMLLLLLFVGCWLLVVGCCLFVCCCCCCCCCCCWCWCWCC